MIKGFNVKIRSIKKEIPEKIFVPFNFAQDEATAIAYVNAYIQTKFTDYSQSTVYKINSVKKVTA